MKILSILIICWVSISFNTVLANDSNFAFDLTKEEGIKLLSGEKNIALLMKASSALKDKLRDDVFSDMKLKFRLIGLEPSKYEWGIPFLAIHFSLIDVGTDLYSGEIALAYNMTAQYDKGKARSYSTVWEDSVIYANADEQSIRNSFKDMMNKFLSVYLEANPRKFIETSTDDKKNAKP